MEIRKTTAVNFHSREGVVRTLAEAIKTSGNVAGLEAQPQRNTMLKDLIESSKAIIKQWIIEARKDSDFSAIVTAMTSEEQKLLLEASNTQPNLPVRAKGFALFRNLFLETRNAHNAAMDIGVDSDHLARALTATAESSDFFANIMPRVIAADFSASEADEAEFKAILGQT